MTRETVLKNARIVLTDEIVSGAILIRDGKIAAINRGNVNSGEDMAGDFVIPGLIELHTDQLESHYAPRPKVRWHVDAAVQAHDAQVAASGITTVFDAMRVGTDYDRDFAGKDMRTLADAIESGVQENRLRADHFLHLRCEVSSADCLETLALFENDDRVKLVSLMDHAPGQRQFVDLETYRTYYMRKMKLTDEEFRVHCEKRMADSDVYSARHRRAIADLAATRNIVLASHDDATSAHVGESLDHGVRIAEFPTTMEAATASKNAGLSILMGAPNIVRGGSHSGNIAARDLVENGSLDILSSDYIPFSLIQSAFGLASGEQAIALPEAIRLVTKNPADAMAMDDRGEIAVGRRADLVRVHRKGAIPVVRTVWREGMRVL
ncbi:alpha-D-ribose 1-methylphosphonate 5-triphosphate diphosphatase [Falsochrobactrum sp. TDYN1]|uniref:Alpha-D-ribose 1-methylphosphonate 5-triphosphate diphosphatase n=1 Tax=Falsochrobactrum tianjinense TaxID=2706015 RepID=A0A949PTD5_9HYPH|nr:alpha-D-ribose 1-methylphosphonate 5-triphosphate diphosphatase [Falsochrobactrum sp. TDYN1]MBV2144545.1 alpha-D-ribose 1-methylphosphonate 5-triphosphate diphosphatase [Falsochrobactrum sp. TDYN1]